MLVAQKHADDEQTDLGGLGTVEVQVACEQVAAERREDHCCT